MAHIKTDKTLSFRDGSRYSYTATPEMGVIKHFPTHVCIALVERGAEWVKKPRNLRETAEAD